MFPDARKRWLAEDAASVGGGLSPGPDEDDTVSLSDDADSCQHPTHSSCSSSEDEGEGRTSREDPLRVWKHDEQLCCGYLGNSNPFGMIAAVIARDSQGNWHPTLRFTVQEILTMLEYDPATCWNVEAPPHKHTVDDEQVYRILGRLYEHGLHLYDLACWLPSVDQTDKVHSISSRLEKYHIQRHVSQRHARRFFKSLPLPEASVSAPSSASASAFASASATSSTPSPLRKDKALELAHINLEPYSDAWKGAYRIAIKQLPHERVEWTMLMSTSYKEAIAAPPPSDNGHHHVHLFQSLLAAWKWCTESLLSAKTHAELRERNINEAGEIIRKVVRLALGPKPGSFVETMAWLEGTHCIGGQVHKNAWTSMLLRWLCMPSDEIAKVRNCSRTMCCPSMQLRSICIWALLFLDVDAIARLTQTHNTHTTTVMQQIAAQPPVQSFTDDEDAACQVRDEVWFGTLPYFLDVGVPLRSFRVRVPKDRDNLDCHIVYDPQKVCLPDPHTPRDQVQATLEQTVLGWCKVHVPQRRVQFATLPVDAMERMRTFEGGIRGWTAAHYLKAMQLQVQASVRREMTRKQKAAQEPPLTSSIVVEDGVTHMSLNVRLYHYRPKFQARTYGYYDVCVWPPLAHPPTPATSLLDLEAFIQQVEHEPWRSDLTLHPLALTRSESVRTDAFDDEARSHHFGIVYWNQLVRLCFTWLAKEPLDFQRCILPNSDQNSEVLPAVYRQVLLYCASTLLD